MRRITNLWVGRARKGNGRNRYFGGNIHEMLPLLTVLDVLKILVATPQCRGFEHQSGSQPAAVIQILLPTYRCPLIVR